MENECKTLAIDTIFTYNGKTYKVIKGCRCIECGFVNRCYSVLYKIHGECSSLHRKDDISVVFKEINNMEIKNNQLTINIPEGMEIDTKNSNLANGIIKFKKKKILTYDDINLNLDKNLTDIIVHKDNIYRLSAIDKLITIAKYYNGNWEPNWNNRKEYKYFILYNNKEDIYMVDDNITFTFSNIYFKNKEDAIAVINNPNFKDILDNIYKN